LRTKDFDYLAKYFQRILMIKSLLSILLLFVSIELYSQDSLGYYHGKASYYGFSGSGNCSFKPPSKPILTAAVNSKQYNKASLCGACIQVIGSKDTVIVHVEDRCPGCKFGGIDLSKTAFATIDDMAKGRIDVRWKVVPCGYVKSMKLYVKKTYNDGSATVLFINHNTPIKSLSIWNDSTWISIERENHNCFHVKKKKDGFTRIQTTDWYGNEIISDSLILTPGAYIDLNQQFAK
jgi:expansin